MSVFFCPAPVPGTLVDTQRFAEALTEAAAAWAKACGQASRAEEVVHG